ncbi:unnamed protein product, partial [Closterium sp. NIES-53]
FGQLQQVDLPDVPASIRTRLKYPLLIHLNHSPPPSSPSIAGSGSYSRFGQLQQVDLSDVPAAIRVGGEELRPDNMREDVVVAFENREEMLSQVPKMDGPFLKVPNVLPSN